MTHLSYLQLLWCLEDAQMFAEWAAERRPLLSRDISYVRLFEQLELSKILNVVPWSHQVTGDSCTVQSGDSSHRYTSPHGRRWSRQFPSFCRTEWTQGSSPSLRLSHQKPRWDSSWDRDPGLLLLHYPCRGIFQNPDWSLNLECSGVGNTVVVLGWLQKLFYFVSWVFYQKI